jgi:uncharacterized protein YjdB
MVAALRRSTFLGLLAVLLTACSDASGPARVDSVAVTAPAASIVAGQTAQLSVVITDEDGNVLTDRPISYSSDNQAIATVSTTGLVNALSPGSVTITVVAEDKTGRVTLTVTPVPIASVTVSPASATVIAGSTQPLTATLADANGRVLTGRTVTWTSSNPAIATVSAAGVVTGVAPGGPVTITATSEGRSGTSQITVIPVPIGSLTLSPNPAEVRVGLTTQLTLIARDAAGNQLGGRPAMLVSSNAAVATVDGNGVVTGVSAGSVTITATAEGRTATTTVNVVPGPVATVEVTPQNLQLRENATRQLTATTRDASGAVVTDRPVTWASSNTSVATVSATGVVLGESAGTATITATSEGRSGSTTVTVLRAQVTSIRFRAFPDPFVVGDTARARAVAVDSVGRELSGRTITYSGSNDAVATVSPSGLMGGVNAGTFTITATSEGVSGTQMGTVTDVYPSFDGLTCGAVRVGATCTASARVRFLSNGNGVPGDRRIVFSSSDPAIARVGDPTTRTSATITGVSPGTVTLTATYVGDNGVTRSRTMPFRVDP